jgi:hypothetical protein
MILNQTQFAKYCGVLRGSVIKGIKAGRVELTENNKIDTENEVNVLYFSDILQKKQSDQQNQAAIAPEPVEGVKVNELQKMTILDLKNDANFKGAPLSVWRLREDMLQKRARREALEIANQRAVGDLLPREFFSFLMGYCDQLNRRLLDSADSLSSTIPALVRSTPDDNEAVIKLRIALSEDFSKAIKDAKQQIKNKIDQYVTEQEKEKAAGQADNDNE